uniref:NADH-ubiquinone oxidoreductase chain 3 n=1 Tax=Zhengitettix curvispinus TaxID=2793214 RepID=A0A7T0II43_9ORTH|nr:NADH dehydrogenase subunit 3 [Zhengitettix curvispinus]
MKLITITMMISSLVPIIMAMITMMMKKKTVLDREKLSPFECGFNPQSKARLPFSIQFFLISMLFLVFDIEIGLILPLMPTMKTSMMTSWWVTASTFIIILISGLYYEWNQGMLKWAS